jgi:hypothetical protein
MACRAVALRRRRVDLAKNACIPVRIWLPKGGSNPMQKLRLSLCCALFTGALAAFAFAFMTAQSGNADNTCVVCHKKTTTLTLGCNSIDYRSHKDHKDPDGPCSASQ